MRAEYEASVRESTAPLRNRENEAVPLLNQQKLAYAVWSYGRTTTPNQAAAVMLYVHSLMGDARPGEGIAGHGDQIGNLALGDHPEVV